MAELAEVTDPRRDSPPCRHKGCGAQRGDRWCYTATGFRRHWHAVRRADVDNPPAAGQPTAPAGKLARRRPSEAQQRILGAAMGNGGLYELSGYTFHGDAQRRAAMGAMSNPARGWFTRLRETQHGTLYEITNAGRAAFYRYEEWMQGGPTS